MPPEALLPPCNTKVWDQHGKPNMQQRRPSLALPTLAQILTLKVSCAALASPSCQDNEPRKSAKEHQDLFLILSQGHVTSHTETDTPSANMGAPNFALQTQEASSAADLASLSRVDEGAASPVRRLPPAASTSDWLSPPLRHCCHQRPPPSEGAGGSRASSILPPAAKPAAPAAGEY